MCGVSCEESRYNNKSINAYLCWLRCMLDDIFGEGQCEGAM